MKIEPLDDKTVKIILSKLDMENFQMTYEEMDYKSPGTKRIILKLIDEIKKESSIDLSKGKLFIEAFPYADGGCILYVNVISLSTEDTSKQKNSFDTPLIYGFEGLDALSSVSWRLNSRYGHVILKNSLYLLNNKYYLSIYTYFKLDAQISHLLNEYGTFFGKGAIASAYIKEHAKELIYQDAIQTIEKCLC